MFREYADAIRARARGRDDGQAIFRAYGLANLAHDVLVTTQAGLRSRGCDVSASSSKPARPDREWAVATMEAWIPLQSVGASRRTSARST
jgi:hypothetical protein